MVQRSHQRCVVDWDQGARSGKLGRAQNDGNPKKHLARWHALTQPDGSFDHIGASTMDVTEAGLDFDDGRERKAIFNSAQYLYSQYLISEGQVNIL